MSQRSERQRIEAFSDAVFAIACTLLVIEIAVPHIEDVRRPGALWPALRSVLPSFVAYLISFTSLLVAWANHHRALKVLVRSSGALLYANGFLLLTITFMPFPTAVLAAYVNTPQANIAVGFYSAGCLAMNIGFNLFWLCILRPVRLLASSVSKAEERRVTRHTLCGFAFYLCTTALSYWSPVTALVLIFGVQVVWIVMSVDEGIRDVTTDSHSLVEESEQEEPSAPRKAQSPWLSTVEA